MQQELKTKWLEALRSGKYRKGIGRLRTTDETGDYYDPLGILLDVFDNTRWKLKGFSKEIKYQIWQYDGDFQAISQNMMVEMKFTEGDTVAIVRTMLMSDMKGFSFKETADWLEKNLR